MDTLFRSRQEVPARGASLASAHSGAPTAARGGLFAEDFDLPRREEVPHTEVVTPSYSGAELAEARAEAWAAGHAAGTGEADTSIAAATRSLLDAISAALRDARAEAGAVAERSIEAIARLLLDSLAKLFPTLCERHGEAELAALCRSILPALAREPAITVRVNPAHTPALMRELDRLDPDLVERVRLVPVEAIAAGDVRVSWRDGSALRDTASLWQQVRAVLEPAGLLSPETASAPETGLVPDAGSARDSALAPEMGVARDPALARDTSLAPDLMSAPDKTPAPSMAPASIKETEHVE
jgi:flagellar assembly protein FliH